MNSDGTSPIFHGDELDPTVRAALQGMISQTPDDAQLQSAMVRLRNAGASSGFAGVPKRPARRGYAVGLTAATFALCVLWLGAQTEAWGQFALSAQQASTEPSAGAVGALSQEAGAERGAVGPVLRFVLLLHVFGLLMGLIGMLVAWVYQLRQWCVATWQPQLDRPVASVWGGRIHLVSLIAYGAGLAFGGVWSQAISGSPWSWDPREGLALVTLGIGTLWYANNWGISAGDPLRQVMRETVVASISVWLIALLYSLSTIYSAQADPRLHSYGFESPLPTAMAAMMVANLLVLSASYFWARSRRAAA